MYQHFVSSYCSIVFHCMFVPHFIYPLIYTDGHLGCFHPLALVNAAVMKVSVQVFA